MRGTWALTVSEFKLNLRDPLMVFWTLAFPALWLLLMAGLIPPIPGFAYEGSSSGYLFLPAAISLTVLSSAFIGEPLTITGYRETKVLRRLRATPVKSLALVTSLGLSQLAFMAVGILVLLLIGRIAFGVRIQGSWLAFAAVTLAGMVTFLAIGGAVGSIARSPRTANIIIWSAFTPMLMLSELFMPRSILPAWLQPIARALPLTPLNTLLRDITYGVPLADLGRLGILGLWAAVSCLVIVRLFKWE